MRLSLPEHLSEHFKAGRHYLVATRKQAFLADQSAVFRRTSGKGPTRFLIADLAKAWRDFHRAIGPQRAFTLADLSKAARVDETILRLWSAAGILCPIEGSFDAQDAFAAGLCGMLRRRGVPVQVIHKVGVFVRTGAGLGMRR